MAQGNFEACLAITKIEEGGKSSNKKDPGGDTMEGVTQKVYDAYRARNHKSKQSVFESTRTERAEIYYKEYWVPANCESMPAGLDLISFDIVVNAGHGRLRQFNKSVPADLPVDKKIHKLAALRMSHWKSLKTLFVTFGKGWTARGNRIEAKAIAMWARHNTDAPHKANIEIVKKSAEIDDAAVKKIGGAVVTSLAGTGLSVFGGHTMWYQAGAGVLGLVAVVFVVKSLKDRARSDAMFKEVN